METDPVLVRPNYGKSDYLMCRVRVRASIGAKDLDMTLSAHLTTVSDEKFKEQQQQDSNMMVARLSDQALRVARTSIGNILDLIEKEPQCAHRPYGLDVGETGGHENRPR